ncbi:hypothetical protein [Chloroflexus sp.]|uniref:hypothetical protein n=1 Tax=Chloroflexus sp. TaxID=1904827 RepID=UPI00262F9512|nr:hypothetical protein [uncultured Chloroflexus sp.]
MPAQPTAGAAPTQAPVATGPFDPRSAEPCAILNAESVAGILGLALITTIPLKDGLILTCSYEFDGQKRVDFEMDLLNPGQEAYDKVIKFQEALGNSVEPVALGDVAAVRDNNGNLALYMVVNGWYIVLYGYGVERQKLIDIGQLLTDRVVAFTPTSAGALVPTTVPHAGALIDMEVVIEAPEEIAGVTRLADLQILPLLGFAVCSSRADTNPYIVGFVARPDLAPPTPLVEFLLGTSGALTVNQPASANLSISIVSDTNAPPMEQESRMFEGEVTITLAEDERSGTFQGGRVKGRWKCTFND